MINTDKLRGIIAERGLTQPKVAIMLGITPKTFYNKMDKRRFDSDEMSQMINLLGISNPVEVFFAEIVAYNAPQQTRQSEAGTEVGL